MRLDNDISQKKWSRKNNFVMLKKHLCVENKTEPTDQGGN